MLINKGWIGVDLDGTLAFYDGWKGADHIGEPVPAMLERVKAWLATGQEVRIFTARVANPDRGDMAQYLRRIPEIEAAETAIQAWCEKHLGQTLRVTCMKDFGMIEAWDDRAVAVEINTGRCCRWD